MISHLTVVADHTPGHHQTDSPEIQWWWPILGPAASNLAGLLAASARTGNATWPVADLAGRLGVHDRIVRQAIERLDLFHVLTFVSCDVATIRLSLPALSDRHLERCTERAGAEFVNAYRMVAA